MERGELSYKYVELYYNSGELYYKHVELSLNSGEVYYNSGEVKLEHVELTLDSGEVYYNSGEVKLEHVELTYKPVELPILHKVKAFWHICSRFNQVMLLQISDLSAMLLALSPGIAVLLGAIYKLGSPEDDKLMDELEVLEQKHAEEQAKLS